MDARDWPETKKAIWREVVASELNGKKYINAWDLTDKIYKAVSDPQKTVSG